MASATAIRDASHALRGILQTELSVLAFPPNTVRVESIDLLPDPVPVPRVTIFLFNISENAFLKNRDALVTSAGPGAVETRPPPTVVDLDFMVCAWMTTTEEEHLVLGDVLRVLYDHPEIQPQALGPNWGPDEQVQVTLTNPSIEDQSRIWTNFGFKRFKLALYYKLRVIPIASARAMGEGIVNERDARPHPWSSPSADHFPPGTI